MNMQTEEIKARMRAIKRELVANLRIRFLSGSMATHYEEIVEEYAELEKVLAARQTVHAQGGSQARPLMEMRR